MNVILTETIRNVGSLGDMVNVKNGYARNYLLPTGKAIVANKQNTVEFEQRRAELEKVAAEKLAAAQKRAEQMENMKVEITARAGDEGKLYGSLDVREIANAITGAGADVAKSEVMMPEGPIRHTGEYAIVLQLHPEVSSTVTVSVVEE